MIKNLKKIGFSVEKAFFNKSEIKKIEILFIKFISRYCLKKYESISKKCSKLLKTKDYRTNLIKLLEEIEKKDRKLFYGISRDFGVCEEFKKIINKNKLDRLLIKYFGKDYSFVQRTDAIMLFNKRNLERLQYKWHQESQFYPNHNKGLHFWFPILRNVGAKNDGGMLLAEKSNKKNYSFKYEKLKDAWTQKIPLIDVEKKYKIVCNKTSLGDVIVFESKVLHKSDQQTNVIPRVSFVIRFISNSKSFIKL